MLLHYINLIPTNYYTTSCQLKYVITYQLIPINYCDIIMNKKPDYAGDEEERIRYNENKMKQAPITVNYEIRCPIKEADFIPFTFSYRNAWRGSVGRVWFGGTLLVPP